MKTEPPPSHIRHSKGVFLMTHTFNHYVRPVLSALYSIFWILVIVGIVATLLLGFYTLLLGDTLGYLPLGDTVNHILVGVGVFDVLILCMIALVIT